MGPRNGQPAFVAGAALVFALALLAASLVERVADLLGALPL